MSEYRWQAGWRKYWRVFLLGWQEQMAYRANNLLESVVGVIAFFVLFFLWRSIYQSNHGQPISGLTLQEMLTYILLAKFWDWAIEPSEEIDNALPQDIRNGGLNRFLIRPISDRLYRLSLYLAHKAMYVLMRIGPVILVIFFFPNAFNLTPNVSWWYLPVAGILALLLQFCFSYTVAMLAFWWLEIWGVLFLKRLIVSFLAGAWLPLTLLPPKIAGVFLALPFQYMIFFPLQIMLGKLAPNLLHQGMLFQLIWVIFFWLTSRLLWSHGMKYYSAAGA